MGKDFSTGVVGDLDGNDSYTPQASGAVTTDDPIDGTGLTLELLLQKWGNGPEGDVSDLATRLAAAMDGSGNPAVTGLGVQQLLYAVASATAAGSSVIPYDGSLPQNDEGVELLTKAITPKLATNLLVIEALVHLAHNAGSTHLIVALFKDDELDAIRSVPEYEAAADKMRTVSLKYQVLAGDLTERTYKIRVGAGQAGTVTINGDGTTSIHEGAVISDMQLTEYKQS